MIIYAQLHQMLLKILFFLPGTLAMPPPYKSSSTPDQPVPHQQLERRPPATSHPDSTPQIHHESFHANQNFYPRSNPEQSTLTPKEQHAFENTWFIHPAPISAAVDSLTLSPWSQAPMNHDVHHWTVSIHIGHPRVVVSSELKHQAGSYQVMRRRQRVKCRP